MLDAVLPKDLRRSPRNFIRGKIAVLRCGLLMEQRLEAQVSVKHARRSRKLAANMTLQEGRVPYAANVHRMNQERLREEKKREEERKAALQNQIR